MGARSRAVLAAGGTGGHIFCAVGMAQALLRAGWEAILISPREERTAYFLSLEPEASGIPLHTYEWKPSLRTLRLPAASFRCRKILGRLKPDLAVLPGGYASVPVGLAARMTGVPTAVFEENAVLGRANRVLSFGAAARLAAMPVAGRDDFQAVGLPLRTRLLDVKPLEKARPAILVMGGSQGARTLDEAMVSLYPQLAAHETRPCIIHSAGPDVVGRAREQFRQHFPHAPEWAGVWGFIGGMEKAYAAADVIVCRAGALTVAEVSFFDLPAVLVPYPFAGYHQLQNARALADARPETTRIVEQGENLPQRLGRALVELLAKSASARRTGPSSRFGNDGTPFVKTLEALPGGR